MLVRRALHFASICAFASVASGYSEARDTCLYIRCMVWSVDETLEQFSICSVQFSSVGAFVHRADRERGGQISVPLGRPVRLRAPHDSHAVRRRRTRLAVPQPDARGAVRAHAGPQGTRILILILMCTCIRTPYLCSTVHLCLTRFDLVRLDRWWSLAARSRRRACCSRASATRTRASSSSRSSCTARASTKCPFASTRCPLWRRRSCVQVRPPPNPLLWRVHTDYEYRVGQIYIGILQPHITSHHKQSTSISCAP